MKITEYTSDRTVRDKRIGHNVRVNIDVEAGSAEKAKEKADIIEEKVYEALEELND